MEESAELAVGNNGVAEGESPAMPEPELAEEDKELDMSGNADPEPEAAATEQDHSERADKV